MEECPTLKEHGVSGWNEIKITSDCSLYWERTFPFEVECDGFDFKCLLLFRGIETDTSANQYEVLFEGKVCFDGLRHLYFGSNVSNNYGYYYYPDINLLILALNALSKLEIEQVAT